MDNEPKKGRLAKEDVRTILYVIPVAGIMAVLAYLLSSISK